MIEHFKISFIGIASWWILLLPFDYTLFDWFFKLIQKPFFILLNSADDELIFETDTYGTYVLIALSLLLGVLSSPIIHWACSKWKLNSTELLKTVLASILFFFLFKYGWDKITKVQFYMPEPNTLYTPFGKLSKDIAYWSLVGSSYSYTFALGFVEILTAILFFFKRTQFLASLIAIAIFGQIVLINVSFDISVKLLAGSLLVFNIIYSSLFSENWRAIFGFSATPILKKNSRSHQMIKYLFTGLVILESILPTLISKNINDDQFLRLAHHGAYKVIGNREIKHVFIHRNNYLILQSWDDELKDYKLDTHFSNQYTTLDGQIFCNWKNQQLIIQNDTFELKKVSYKNLPLLQESFHTFSDQFH